MINFRKRLVAALVLLGSGLPLTGAAEAPPLIHAGSAYDDGKGAQLRRPEGIACTDAGRLVVGDTANGRLVFFEFRDGAFKPGAVLAFPELGRPVRVQIDSRGGVLSFDQKTRRIVRVGPEGTFAGFVELQNVPPSATPSFPVGFKLDRSDNLYVLDVGANRVVVADNAGFFSRAIPLPKGGFITDIAVDRSGTVYAVDGVRAQVYAAPRNATSFAPRSKSLKEFMNFPAYASVVEGGRLVLVDKNGSGLVTVGPDGSFQGRQLSQGWNDGLVYYPAQICLTEGGVTFVADRNNNRVQAFVTAQ